jgi:phosphatidylserine/phosphatidylglycerophosphate/cardiolipin synthase-like enzyme
VNLASLSTAALQRLRDALRAGRVSDPVDSLDLELLGMRTAGALIGARCAELAVAIDAALAERAAAPNAPQLVWTGPDGKSSSARDTAVVLQELFERAQRCIVVAGFRFDHGATLLRALHAALAERGVSAQLFIDSEGADRFIAEHWPFGPPFPELFVFRAPEGVFASLHAKCVIVDSRHALITSANFTDRGQTRNIEAGVLLDDPALAHELEAQLRAALAAGAFEPLVGR